MIKKQKKGQNRSSLSKSEINTLFVLQKVVWRQIIQSTTTTEESKKMKKTEEYEREIGVFNTLMSIVFVLIMCFVGVIQSAGSI